MSFTLSSRRAGILTILAAMISVLLAVPAQAGTPSNGTSPVTAADRTSIELLAEAYMLDAHNDQRAAGRTRNGKTYTDVSRAQPLTGYTGITTVARRWSDLLSMDNFRHNPEYSKQYGHWSAVGENIAITTIGPKSGGTPTSSEVRAAAEKLMQMWWESGGHRRNWMRSDWDHLGVGVAIELEDVGAREPYWVMAATADFRRHDGSSIRGRAFPADGSTPPNESDGASKPTASKSGSTSRFRDVPASHTFHRNIEALASSGVTKGCGSDRYCPNDNVTRGQMAAFLTRALGLPAGSATFSDSRRHTFEAPIAALARAGVTKGCGGSRFCPNDAVTRGEMAAFLTRALGLPAGSAKFSDTRGHTFEAPIAALARAGITTGCGGGKFCPDEPVTRGQMAAFLDRAGLLD